MARSSGFGKIIVLGAGAIGSYYGAMLSRRFSVLLVGREPHVAAVREHGLLVSGAVEGTFRLEAATTLEPLLEDSLLIVTVKACDLKAAVEANRDIIRDDTTILLLQNGLGNEAVATSALGPGVQVVRGLANTGVEYALGRISVKHTGETILPMSRVGEWIRDAFASCGLETRLTDRMDYEVWRKLTMNCVINPLSAILKVPDGDVAAEPLRALREGIAEECIAVAAAEGVTLEPTLPAEITGAAASYTNLSSMCQDILRGRRTEIGFLNGRVVELGRLHGVATPFNETVTGLIRFMEGKK
jgi:2-dehydropantoate 2-reductase